MEEELNDETFRNINTSMAKAPSIEPGALSPDGEHNFLSSNETPI